jgi:hypothetical protein
MERVKQNSRCHTFSLKTKFKPIGNELPAFRLKITQNLSDFPWKKMEDVKQNSRCHTLLTLLAVTV